jgi:5-methylcytosine-specific restriction endonuclease McrA
MRRIEAVKNDPSGSTRGRPRLEVASERAVGSPAVFLCVRAAIKAVKKKRHFNEYRKERLLSDAHYAAETRCRSRLRMAMLRMGHGKASNTMDLVGCTSKELVDHLGAEQWSKRHELDLVIDHIWPLAAYDLADPDQQSMCFNFRNLRLCTSTENLSKSNQLPDQQLRNTVPQHLWPYEFQ